MARKLPVSIQARLFIPIIAGLVTLTAALTWSAHRSTHNAYAASVDQANQVGVATIVNQLSAEFPGLSAEVAEGSVGAVRWPDMPEALPDDAIDNVGNLTGVAVTIFRWNPASQEFVRDATTIQTPNGRAVGTLLARGAVYDAMIAGQPFVGEADILGLPYITYYHPVMNSSGQAVGIFFAGYEVAAIAATQRSQLFKKLIIGFVLMATVIAASFFAIRSVIRPLERSRQAISSLSDGNFSQDIADTERADEVGDINRGLVVLRKSMQEAEQLKLENDKIQDDQGRVVEALNAALSTLSQLDLRTHIDNNPAEPFPENFESMRVSFNNLVDRLADTISALSTASGEINRSALDLNTTADDLSQRSTSQAATLEESTAALTELTDSVRSTAERATMAKTSMDDNRSATEEAGIVVADAEAAMNEIERSSDEIRTITGVIEDIAFQTNLLALNAGVEAARAGEAGRGFAVVATEVRQLSQRASDSAQQIQNLISNSGEQVAQGSRLVGKAGEALRQIIDRIATVSEHIDQIAQAAQDQATGIDELATGVRELDTVTQRNSAVAQETSDASTYLRQRVEGMSAHVMKFKVLDEDSTGQTAGAPVIAPMDPEPMLDSLEQVEADASAHADAHREAPKFQPNPSPAAAVAVGGSAWTDF